jgi:hypothetical protein
MSCTQGQIQGLVKGDKWGQVKFITHIFRLLHKLALGQPYGRWGEVRSQFLDRSIIFGKVETVANSRTS